MAPASGVPKTDANPALIPAMSKDATFACAHAKGSCQLVGQRGAGLNRRPLSARGAPEQVGHKGYRSE